MPFDTFDFDSVTEKRRQSIAQSIRQLSLEDVKKMGQQLFKYADDPWRDAFNQFLGENPGATFYHADASEGVNILYCPDKDRGIWFVPGTGLGPLQETGRRTMKGSIK
jgi:hypothetical protein